MRKAMFFLCAAILSLNVGCFQLVNPELQKKVDEAFLKAASSADKVVRVKEQINDLYEDYKAGKLTAEDAIPRLNTLKQELEDAARDAETAYANAVDVQKFAQENNIPWWQVGLTIALGALGTGGVVARTYGGKLAQLQEKYGGAVDGIRKLVIGIESNDTTKETKQQISKMQDPEIEAIVREMNSKAK